MKNSTLTIFAAAGALLASLGSCSSSNPETTTTPPAAAVPTNVEATSANTSPTGSDSVTAPADTISFQALAASSDITEVLSSVQAKAKAKNAEVKKFAEQMITDHTKTSEELKQIATKRNFILPTSPLSAHQRMLTKLTNEKDADEFDEEYMDMQVTMHKQAVELFESAAKNQTDPELKAFAAKHLPHLKMHLELARKNKDLVK